MVAALVGVARVAPPGGPRALVGGAWWRRAASGTLATAIYLPRVLYWRPTWPVAALWAAAWGEPAQLPPVWLLLGWRRGARSTPEWQECRLAPVAEAADRPAATPCPPCPSACVCVALHCVEKALRPWVARPPAALGTAITLGIMAGWHALLWRACGGDWGAVAGECTQRGSWGAWRCRRAAQVGHGGGPGTHSTSELAP
jgi:hypothetical protein